MRVGAMTMHEKSNISSGNFQADITNCSFEFSVNLPPRKIIKRTPVKAQLEVTRKGRIFIVFFFEGNLYSMSKLTSAKKDSTAALAKDDKPIEAK